MFLNHEMHFNRYNKEKFYNKAIDINNHGVE